LFLKEVALPEPSRYASVVAQSATCGSVSNAPEKVNACFAVASFFLERVKFQFIEK